MKIEVITNKGEVAEHDRERRWRRGWQIAWPPCYMIAKKCRYQNYLMKNRQEKLWLRSTTKRRSKCTVLWFSLKPHNQLASSTSAINYHFDQLSTTTLNTRRVYISLIYNALYAVCYKIYGTLSCFHHFYIYRRMLTFYMH